MFNVVMSFDKWSSVISVSQDKKEMSVRGKRMISHSGIPYDTIKNGGLADIVKYSACSLIASYNSYIIQSRGDCVGVIGDLVDLDFKTSDSIAIVSKSFFRMGKRIGQVDCKCANIEVPVVLEIEENVESYHEFQYEDCVFMSLFFNCDSLLDKKTTVCSENGIDSIISCFLGKQIKYDDFDYEWDGNLIIFDNGRISLDKLMNNGGSFIFVREYPTLDGDYYQKQMINGRFLVYNRVFICNAIGADYEYKSSLKDCVSMDDVYYVSGHESYNYLVAFKNNGIDLRCSYDDERFEKLTKVNLNPTITFYEDGFDPTVEKVLDLRDGRLRFVKYHGTIIPDVRYYYEGSNLQLKHEDRYRGIYARNGVRYVHATKSFSFLRRENNKDIVISVKVVSNRITYKDFKAFYKKRQYTDLGRYVI